MAIWQTLYPNAWFDGSSGSDNVTSKTPLEPFHRDERGTVYTSDDVRRWFDLGYTYPELRPWLHPDNNRYIQEVRSQVNQLYGRTRQDVLFRSHTVAFSKADEVEGEAMMHHSDYIVDIEFERSDLHIRVIFVPDC